MLKQGGDLQMGYLEVLGAGFVLNLFHILVTGEQLMLSVG